MHEKIESTLREVYKLYLKMYLGHLDRREEILNECINKNSDIMRWTGTSFLPGQREILRKKPFFKSVLSALTVIYSFPKGLVDPSHLRNLQNALDEMDEMYDRLNYPQIIFCSEIHLRAVAVFRLDTEAKLKMLNASLLETNS